MNPVRRIGIAVALVAMVVPWPARAAVHEVSVGNYYYEHDETRARDPIVVKQGDQIRFTIRQTAAPPHSVNIDEYGIRSGDMPLLFETYTTPPLDKPGTFSIYCRAHRDRPHETTLIVEAEQKEEEARPKEPRAQEPKGGSGGSSGAGGSAPEQEGTVAPSEPDEDEGRSGRRAAERAAAEVAGQEVAPEGRGVATDQRRAPAEPGSLEDILGRRVAAEGVWTRSVGLAGLAAIPIALAAAFALRQESRRRAAKG